MKRIPIFEAFVGTFLLGFALGAGLIMFNDIQRKTEARPMTYMKGMAIQQNTFESFSTNPVSDWENIPVRKVQIYDGNGNPSMLVDNTVRVIAGNVCTQSVTKYTAFNGGYIPETHYSYK